MEEINGKEQTITWELLEKEAVNVTENETVEQTEIIEELQEKPKEKEPVIDPLNEAMNGFYDEIQPEPIEDEEPQEESTAEDFTEKKEEPEIDFSGVKVSDFITAALALDMYEGVIVGILQIVAKFVLKHPRDIHDDELKASDQMKGISADLLDVYWQTLHVKINPVIGAACIMAFCNIKNFVDVIKEDHKKEKNKEETVDVDHEDVTEERSPQDWQKIFDEEEGINDNVSQTVVDAEGYEWEVIS